MVNKSKYLIIAAAIITIPFVQNKSLEVSAASNDESVVEKNTENFDTLKINNFSAEIDKSFPRVRQYKIDDEIFYGQTSPISTLKINNIDINPKVNYKKINSKTAEYILTIKNAKEFIDAEITVRLSVENNQLNFDVIKINNNNNIKPGKKIDNTKKLIDTIDFNKNNLISVSSSQSEAKLDMAKMSVNTHVNGDKHFDITKDFNSGKDIQEKAMYGFVSNNKISAGMWSNSQYSSGKKADDYTRLTINGRKTTTESNNSYSVGISNSPFYYQGSHDKVVYPKYTFDLPQAKVIFTKDANKDGVVDWQDAAIAYRNIMNNPMGADDIPNNISNRITMNFASQAQNPFLKTLDDIKKVNLNTDGLGQGLILKGYGSEGHDSGHLNYADIGTRMGGAKDFKYLLSKAPKYGANIGIHVNASETYPESKYFSETILKKTGNGDYHYGWNWLDQAINIDSDYDLANGRNKRWDDLKKIVGEDLPFMYVDVWGQGASGKEQAWETRQLAKEINEHGWRLGAEWGYSGEYDSTFQHWATDLDYGTFENKGINSNIARFIHNHQKDSWDADYIQNGGTSNAPLLGGTSMKHFEGWQDHSDYNEFIKNTFETNLPTKFLQHYLVNTWRNGNPVTMSDNNETYSWIPEMEIKLKSPDKSEEVVVNRESNDVKSENYRNRTIKLNGKTILKRGSYLIPWYWKSNGDKLNNKKLYYFNSKKEKTTWELPIGWDSKKVFIYELTSQGKTNESIINVTNKSIDLDLKANTPYVLYKEHQKSDYNKKDINWGEGTHLYDPGFNSEKLDKWDIKSNKKDISIAKTTGGNPMLRLNNSDKPISMRQKLTGLKPNTNYSMYSAVDNRSNSIASMSVIDDKMVFENTTNKSMQKNFVPSYSHANQEESYTVDGSSYFQNLYVFFKTGDKVNDIYLNINKEPGNGSTFIDDIRIVENNSKMYDNKHSTKEAKVFKQDFEDVTQGLYPFVTNMPFSDSRTHLSEKHAPYTQKGWNGKQIDDVITGKWSLKINGLVQKNKVIYRTIPQNFKFEPDKDYKVSFDYETGSDNTYAFSVGDGENEDLNSMKVTPLKKENNAKKITFEVRGSKTGDTWVGIYSTNVLPKTNNETDELKNFRGYNDFILDNLKIENLGS